MHIRVGQPILPLDAYWAAHVTVGWTTGRVPLIHRGEGGGDIRPVGIILFVVVIKGIGEVRRF